MLLVGAGLLLRTYDRLLGVDLGFDPANVRTFMLALPEEPYDEDPMRTIAFFDQMVESIERLPGVKSVGGALGRPFSGNSMSTGFHFLDRPTPERGTEESARIRVALPGYFETLRVPLLEGRTLDKTDRREREPVVVVNRAFADSFGEGTSVIGRKIQLQIGLGFDEEPERTIVGVVGNIRAGSVREASEPATFVPQAQMASPWMGVVIRADESVTWTAIEQSMNAIDANVPLHRKTTLVAAIENHLGPARFYLLLLGSFAAMALFLAAIGLYGVISTLVTQRTRELAIRQALGANPMEVTTHVLRQGALTVASGVAVGLVAAWASSRLLGTLLYDVAPNDPTTYGLVVVALLGVALLALLAPALRAARVSPVAALKE